MRSTLLLLFTLTSLCLGLKGKAQSYVFAQLTGAPMATSGWNLTGNASVGDVTGSGSSELILTTALTNQSGGIFYNQAINLSQCTKWIVEFDFRMYGGSMADGLAFCFLDVPPTGFVSGGGLGIPATANGLKVCFDTYNNCGEGTFNMPKIELRWGSGYAECSTLPTRYNTGGDLSFMRSPDYNRAKIEYNNGVINVYVNNVLYLTGTQTFNFQGYFGFTASTGSLTDIHSIKNVVIYTNMPQSQAGPSFLTLCSGNPATIGTAPTSNYSYQWTPTTGLNDPTLSNPQITLTNNTSSPITQRYRVNTTFSDGTGCASSDSIDITVLPAASLQLAASATTICQGTPVTFTATPANVGNAPLYQWKINGSPVGTNSTSFSSSTLANGDVITCEVTTNGCSPVASNAVQMVVTPLITPAVTISSPTTTICKGKSLVFTATSPTGNITNWQWKVNGTNAGSNSATFTATNLVNGDVVTCEITSNANCLATTQATSNALTISVETPLPVSLGADRGFCPAASVVLDAGTNHASYLWNTGATSSTITVTTAGNYSIIAYSALGCETYDTVAITAYPAPVVSLPAPAPICIGSSLTLDPGSFSSYLWNDGSTSRTISVSTVGTYTVAITDSKGCAGSATTSITSLLPLPASFLPLDTAICSYGTIDLKPLQPYSAYTWSTGSNSSVITITKAGTYWLDVTDNKGCKGRDSIDVLPKECLKGIFVPTGFTPNGDRQNDVFRPLLFGDVKSYQFTVYNRWGNVVFYSTQLGKGWDGNIQGVRQPTGVFIWSCTYAFEGEQPHTEKGTVLLVR